MKKVLTILWLLTIMSSVDSAQALTIRNKCGYPVAGSILSADLNVNMGQFRLAPGEKVKLLKGARKIKLVMSMTPDVYKLDKLGISKTKIDNPNAYIELKQGKEGIIVKMY